MVTLQDKIKGGWDNDRIKWYFDKFPGLYDDIYVNLTFVEVFEQLRLKPSASSHWLNPRTDAQIMATEAVIYSNEPPK